MSNKGPRGKVIPMKQPEPTKEEQIEQLKTEIKNREQKRDDAYESGLAALKADIGNVVHSMRTAEGCRAVLVKDIRNELTIDMAQEIACGIVENVASYTDLVDGIEVPDDLITCFDNTIDNDFIDKDRIYTDFIKELVLIEFYQRFGKQGYDIAMAYQHATDEIKDMEKALFDLEFALKDE